MPFVFLWVLVLFTAASCGETDVPLLASLERVRPHIVEPGDVIRIDGSGFVEGPAEVTLRGLFKPAGLAEAETRSVYLEGIAISERLVEIQVSTSLMKRLADEPTQFKGSMEVAFPHASQLESVHIIARGKDIELDIRPAGGGVPLAARRSRKAHRFLQDLGLTLADRRSGDGLVVAEVADWSSAGQANIESGDRLLAVDGTPLASPADLDGIARFRSHRFEFVSRNGTIRKITLKIQADASLDPDELTAIMLSSLVLGLFLAFAAPTNRWFGRPSQHSTDPLVKATGFGIVSIPLLLVPAGTVLSRSGFGASLLLVGLNVLGLAGVALFGGGKKRTRALAFFAHLLPMPVIMVVAGASGSAVGLWDVVTSQKAAPWGWHVWSSPFALAAIIATLALLWPSKSHGQGNERAVTIASWIAAVPAAAMLTSCCLGGWLIPGVPVARIEGSGALLALGCLLFFAKTWTVLLIARWFVASGLAERRALTTETKLWLRFFLLALAAAASLFWMWVDLPEIYRVAGQVVATAAFVTFFTALTILGLKSVLPRLGQSFD